MIKKQTTVKTEHAVFKKKMIGKNVKNRDLIVKIVKKEDKSTPTPNKDMIFIKNCPIDILPLASMPKAKSMTPLIHGEESPKEASRTLLYIVSWKKG